jgi:HAE1 family hydrophobic/amphiphilic exporter-1
LSLPEFSIRRPVTTMMIYIAVVLFGIISYMRLAQELFPPISYPQLSIVTPYENAAPEEIETLITRPIEEAVGGISGLRRVSSISREGLSLVVVEFGWNQNMDFGSLAVREKIDLIKERLPRDAQEPIVMKFNPFELPVMTISVSSSERNPVQLKLLAKRWFKDEIEKIHGVASASISGGSDEQILVDVDQAKIRTAGVSINEVSEAITQSNLNYPGGTIKESFYEYLVRTLGEFKQIDEVGKIVVKRENIRAPEKGRYDPDLEKNPSNRLILLSDVADIRRTEKERTSFSRFNSLENVTIAIQKQAQGNSLEIVNAIRKRLKELGEQLPKDIKIDIISDKRISRFEGFFSRSGS